MEKEGLMEMNGASAPAVEKQEGDVFLVNNGDQDKESKEVKTEDIGCNAHAFGDARDDILDKSSQAVEMTDGDAFTFQNEDQHLESKESKAHNIDHDDSKHDDEQDDISDRIISQAGGEKLGGDAFTIKNHDQEKESEEEKIQISGYDGLEFDNEQADISDNINRVIDVKSNTHAELKDNVTGGSQVAQRIDESKDLQCGPQQENLEISDFPGDLVHESNSMKSEIHLNIVGQEYPGDKSDDRRDFEPKSQEVNLDNNAEHNGLAKENEDSRSMESKKINRQTYDAPNEDNNLKHISDGTEVSRVEVSRGTSSCSLDADPETPHVVEKVVALTNFVRDKSATAVSNVLRHLAGKSEEGAVGNSNDEGKDVSDLSKNSESKEASEKTVDKTSWNPLNYIKAPPDVDEENKTDQTVDSITEDPPQPIAMKGRIILYTRLGCKECKEVRQFLYRKGLRYVEINIDVYPSRKMELEKNIGSTSVPKVFFNEMLIGDKSELMALVETGKLDEKIDFLVAEAPSFLAPLPPLSGEDDASCSGALDEMALIVRKMKESVPVKDRFSKMRRFTNCFVGSEAVDFLSEDQYLERTEAVEFARKLATKLFFQHVADENLFEDGYHLYRFLDDDPIVGSQCQNIPRGIITVKPKPVTEIASRLRLLSYAMFEAYASEDGCHVDYRSIHGSEEFARYLRTVEELQRVEIWELSREEKLAFFINLYNMMTIHAILVWGHPAGTLERRRLFGDFKYVIGGTTYSLSVIQNGILRGNQRPPYNLMKPFGAKDKRSKVAFPYPEPLTHFALVSGTRSGPALRCYSPRDIDKELMDAARDFLRSGGLLIDFTAKVAHASKILKWFSVDFGKNEVEVLKHVSNYLDPADSEVMLDLLATSELKVIYQPFDWGLNS